MNNGVVYGSKILLFCSLLLYFMTCFAKCLFLAYMWHGFRFCVLKCGCAYLFLWRSFFWCFFFSESERGSFRTKGESVGSFSIAPCDFHGFLLIPGWMSSVFPSFDVFLYTMTIGNKNVLSSLRSKRYAWRDFSWLALAGYGSWRRHSYLNYATLWPREGDCSQVPRIWRGNWFFSFQGVAGTLSLFSSTMTIENKNMGVCMPST